MHQASGPPGSERLWKNCLRKAGKLVERAKTMMTRASPDLIYRVSGSPHLTSPLTSAHLLAADGGRLAGGSCQSARSDVNIVVQ